MTEENKNNETTEAALARDKREQRVMWIFSAAIVLLILGGMGANMLFHKDTPATDISSQARTTAPQQ